MVKLERVIPTIIILYGITGLVFAVFNDVDFTFIVFSKVISLLSFLYLLKFIFYLLLCLASLP